MFGGKGSNGNLNDLWYWDGSESEWMPLNLSPNSATPDYQEGVIFYYDELNETTTLLNNSTGSAGSSGFINSTIWSLEYDPANFEVSWNSNSILTFNFEYPHGARSFAHKQIGYPQCSSSVPKPVSKPRNADSWAEAG